MRFPPPAPTSTRTAGTPVRNANEETSRLASINLNRFSAVQSMPTRGNPEQTERLQTNRQNRYHVAEDGALF